MQAIEAVSILLVSLIMTLMDMPKLEGKPNRTRHFVIYFSIMAAFVVISFLQILI